MEPELEKIKSAADGLLFISESDHPLEPVILTNAQTDVEKEIRVLSKKNETEAVETQTLEYFFRNHVKTYPDASPEQTQTAKRFADLTEVLNKNLSGVKVYRVGSVQVDAFILGKLKDGRFAGLRTKLIET